MLNENIKKFRVANALSQVEMAKKLGVSKQCVSNWENDNVVPSVEMLIKIAGLFRVSTDCLLGLDEKKYLEITGLDDNQLAHIQAIINDIAK
ncbi:MAG: helix-turn-helix domain-containing protein [Bacteroides sp.]|nr:helix-turn-helix domain-containing protein [Bacillota bacterium]MCM1393404.1 helix-turn-helix domain-containing protein [[Eubacterium] siraeum]MCM1455390.1 helix-turn-helix domain-containing protein [Bacteroides sp.]